MENKEKIEEKNNCCENISNCNNCTGCMRGCFYHCNKKHMMKKIIVIILIVIAFFLGTHCCQMKSWHRDDYRYGRDGMMGSKYNDKYRQAPQEASGSVTVDVSKTPTEKTQ